MKQIFVLLVVLLAGVLSAQGYWIYQAHQTDARVSQGGFQFALENSPTYQSTRWVNQNRGLNGSTIPIKTYQLASGQYCRDYLTTVERGGSLQQVLGTACRQANGAWKIAQEMPVRQFAALNGVVRSDNGRALRCPRHFLPQMEVGQRGRALPRFTDPYLAHLHWFLYMNPASGNYHHWQNYHGRNFDQGDLRRFHRWIHPPVTPAQPVRKKIPDLVKFAVYHPGD